MLSPATRSQFLLRAGSRWTFLVALAYAPWAYGCTSSATIIGLNSLLGLVLALCLVGCAAKWLARVRTDAYRLTTKELVRMRSALVLGIATTLLLLIGWWMVWNAHAIYDSAFYLPARLAAPFPGLAGSVDQAISAAWMVRATLLLGVIWLVADVSRDPVWLLRIWWTVALTGGSIALLGLVQKAMGAEAIFWAQWDEVPVTTFFATYFYHANAGAFLNLVLPATIGLTVRSLTSPTPAVLKAAALIIALLNLGATAANTSRMAQVVAGLLLVVLALFAMRWARRARRLPDWKPLLGSVALVALTLAAIAQASRLAYSVERWSRFSQTAATDARWLASKAALRAVPDAGWMGFGPGTFRVIFPYYTADFGARLGGFWRFLHQDYLQTILEWGWIGSVLWALIFFGGMVAGLISIGRARKQWRPRHRMFLQLTLLALAGVALHACVDFPLQIASLQLYVATYLGVCWGSSSWK